MYLVSSLNWINSKSRPVTFPYNIVSGTKWQVCIRLILRVVALSRCHFALGFNQLYNHILFYTRQDINNSSKYDHVKITIPIYVSTWNIILLWDHSLILYRAQDKVHIFYFYNAYFFTKPCLNTLELSHWNGSNK